MRTSPALNWLWSSEGDFVRSVGATNNGTFVLHTDSTLMGINVSDGSLRWSLPLTHNITAAVTDTHLPMFYSFDSGNSLRAYSIETIPEDPQDLIEHSWTIRSYSSSTPLLLPLPDGGVALHANGRFIGYSAEGDILWESYQFERLYDWVSVDDEIVLTTAGRDGTVWSIGANGPTPWGIDISGHLDVFNGSICVYNDQGVFRLTHGLSTIQPIHFLPEGFIRLGDIIALPGTGILLDHTDISDRRIILLDQGGTILWQRSYSALLQGQLHLFEVAGWPYLMALMETSAADVYASKTSSEIAIYSIDLENGDLTLIFTGGTRHPDPIDFTLHPINDHQILINIGGTSLVSLDLRLNSE